MYGYAVRVNINIIVAHCHHMLVGNISKTKKETVCVANVRKSMPHMHGLLLMCQRKGYYHYIQRNYLVLLSNHSVSITFAKTLRNFCLLPLVVLIDSMVVSVLSVDLMNNACLSVLSVVYTAENTVPKYEF